jgi:multidrug resistance efflux pump
MMYFADITEFQHGYKFFMLRPSRVGFSFIITVAAILAATFIWALIAKMDDVVKTTVLLRPADTISTIKTLAGGEVQRKNYTHNEFVGEGALLLQLDISSDVLELKNSRELMVRITKNIFVYNSLLATIRSNKNLVSKKDEEAYIHSERYILEYRRQLAQIEDLRIKLEREQNLPETLLVKQRIDDNLRELERSELQFELWKNSQIIDVTTALKDFTYNRETLERRISDLERNIRNATIYAPIAGRINEHRKLNIGDNVVPGEEIVAIIPDGSTELVAELYVEPAYIARVKTGQKATLRFPGLPPSKYGKIEAEIFLIPADFTAGPESTPVFIVQAKITEPWLVSPEGERVDLRAGIGAVGRIIIDQDTVLRMVLKKLDFINETYDQKALAKDTK